MSLFTEPELTPKQRVQAELTTAIVRLANAWSVPDSLTLPACAAVEGREPDFVSYNLGHLIEDNARDDLDVLAQCALLVHRGSYREVLPDFLAFMRAVSLAELAGDVPF